MQNLKYEPEEIQQYLEQKMSANEKQEFEAYMSQNADFRKEVELKAFVIHKNRQEKRKEFAAIRDKHQKTKTIYLKKWWKVAAIVVFAVGLGIVSYQYIGEQQTAKELALQEWQTPKKWSSTRMGDKTASDLSEQIKEIYQAAYEKYEEGKSEEALAILAKTPNSEEAIKKENWLLTKELEAHIYFEQKKYKKAIAIYENLISRNIKGKGSAKMKLALCYLADEQAEKAKPILEELQHIGQFEEQAKNLLKAMN